VKPTKVLQKNISQYLQQFPTENNSILWKIKGCNVKEDCYIFGTMHFIKDDNFYFPKSLSNIILSCQQIVTEINYSDSDTDFLLLPEGESLFDKFTDQQSKQLVEWGTNQKWMNYDPISWKKQFDRYRLFSMAQMVIYGTIVQTSKHENYVDIKSYEQEIYSLALTHNIEIFGLETVQEQISFLDKLSEKQQIDSIMEWITNPKQQIQRFNELTTVYLDRNVDKIYQFVKIHEEFSPEISKMLLTIRNQNWISKIEQFISQKSSFIAVGAAHLGGQNGVLRLLEKNEYQLSPVHLQ